MKAQKYKFDNLKGYNNQLTVYNHKSKPQILPESQSLRLNNIKGNHNQATINNNYGSTATEKALREIINLLTKQIELLSTQLRQPIYITNNIHNEANSKNIVKKCGNSRNKISGIKSKSESHNN